MKDRSKEESHQKARERLESAEEDRKQIERLKRLNERRPENFNHVEVQR